MSRRQYVGRMRTPASVVAGVDFGDADFAQDIRDGVARIEELMRNELGRADELMSEAVQHLFLAGGKRFRPLFTVLAASLGPRPDSPDVAVAGAVIEMVHLATLYHDDVMDEAQVRRGLVGQLARAQHALKYRQHVFHFRVCVALELFHQFQVDVQLV